MLEVIGFITYAVIAAAFCAVLWRLIYAARHFTPPKSFSTVASETDLPSVTVCIPARNEKHALTECLERVIASTYEKLEIIVLDDGSNDNTSVLIKSFAHAGVRFVQGNRLPKGWLGKNHALQELYKEASGSYILFMDVDTRISPTAIENIVRYSLSKHAAMVSVLPRREDGWRASVLLSPLRYFWELLFHRASMPASSSNAWLIRRDVLRNRFHGFEFIKKAILPEARLAAELHKTNEYRFLIGSEKFGIAYEKKWRSQLMTSVRLSFPLLRMDIGVAMIAFFDLLLFLVPAVVVAYGVITQDWSLHQVFAAILLVFGAALYGLYTKWTSRRWYIIGAILWPGIVLQEAVLIIVSVIQYSRKAVTWKGRPIVVPEAQN